MSYTEPDNALKIESESDFYQRVKKRTVGSVYWERIEPSNECGFPDTYFRIKSRGCANPEGTLELKYKATHGGTPSLSGDLLRGSQKSALIDYHSNGGNRRFFLVYSADGDVWFFNTADAYHSIVKGEARATAVAKLEEPGFCAWLLSLMGKSW